MTIDDTYIRLERVQKEFLSNIQKGSYEQAYSLFEEFPDIINTMSLDNLSLYYHACFKERIPSARIKTLELTIKKKVFGEEK